MTVTSMFLALGGASPADEGAPAADSARPGETAHGVDSARPDAPGSGGKASLDGTPGPATLPRELVLRALI